MTTEEQLIQMLAMMARTMRAGPASEATRGWKFRSFAEFALAEGRIFRPAKTPDMVPRWRRGAPSTCYVAASLWAVDADLAYVEGWAATGLLSFGTEHAWCATAGADVALDPTWDEPGDAYLGIAFNPRWRRNFATPALLTTQHQLGRDLLHHGLPDEARIDTGLPLPTVRTPHA